MLQILTDKIQKINGNQHNPYNLRSILFSSSKVSDRKNNLVHPVNPV